MQKPGKGFTGCHNVFTQVPFWVPTHRAAGSSSDHNLFLPPSPRLPSRPSDFSFPAHAIPCSPFSSPQDLQISSFSGTTASLPLLGLQQSTQGRWTGAGEENSEKSRMWFFCLSSWGTFKEGPQEWGRVCRGRQEVFKFQPPPPQGLGITDQCHQT